MRTKQHLSLSPLVFSVLPKQLRHLLKRPLVLQATSTSFLLLFLLGVAVLAVLSLTTYDMRKEATGIYPSFFECVSNSDCPDGVCRTCLVGEVCPDMIGKYCFEKNDDSNSKLASNSKKSCTGSNCETPRSCPEGCTNGCTQTGTTACLPYCKTSCSFGCLREDALGGVCSFTQTPNTQQTVYDQYLQQNTLQATERSTVSAGEVCNTPSCDCIPPGNDPFAPITQISKLEVCGQPSTQTATCSGVCLPSCFDAGEQPGIGSCPPGTQTLCCTQTKTNVTDSHDLQCITSYNRYHTFLFDCRASLLAAGLIRDTEIDSAGANVAVFAAQTAAGLANTPFIGPQRISDSLNILFNGNGDTIDRAFATGYYLSGSNDLVDASNRLFYQIGMSPEEAAAYRADATLRLGDAATVGLTAVAQGESVAGSIFHTGITYQAGKVVEERALNSVPGVMEQTGLPCIASDAGCFVQHSVSDQLIMSAANGNVLGTVGNTANLVDLTLNPTTDGLITTTRDWTEQIYNVAKANF